MRVKRVCRRAADLAMTAALLLLMGYHLWGDAVHEWAGAGMFLLFLLHHGLNAGWYGSLFRGKWTGGRIAQTAIDGLLFVDMLCLMVSGVTMSRHVFGFLHLGGMGLARSMHLAGSYWGFVLMSVHIGLHWGVVMGLARKAAKPAPAAKILLRVCAGLTAAYGLWAFIRRGFLTYMFLQNQFVFFDFSEPALLFYLDYLAIMGLFAALGYYGQRLLRRPHRREEAE